MKSFGIKTASVLSSAFAIGASAQQVINGPGGVVASGNILPDGPTQGGFSFGIALPPAGQDGAGLDYIGVIQGSRINGAGWSGISHQSGMPNALLMMAWVDGTSVRTSFRFAAGYVEPEIYTGNATVSKIAETVNATHFTLSYLCSSCLVWDQNGATGGQPAVETADHTGQVFGWVQSLNNVEPVTSSTGVITEHNNGMGAFGIPMTGARNAKYADWKAAAVPPTGTSPNPPTSTAPAACSGTAAPKDVYDYIVVGAGAAGIPIADKLSEGGKSVLLLEKGPASSGRWGGSIKPDWLAGTNLTRFDVPGLCNQIWVQSGGIACTGIDQMAGCVLGGGTAVNAALWWKPPTIDWDTNFPSGWKSGDMKSAVDRVFSRIPGTDHPSKDGRLYKQEGYTVLSNALAAGGWKNLTRGANAEPDSKNKVFAQTPYMFSNGERGGPMSTYLVTASARKNFKLITNASVRRIVRTGGHATGVELEAGICGTINVTPNTGRVILAAGVFNTAKVLFRSGIGPTPELTTVSTSAIDKGSMINSTEWINLPVGKNLYDHVNTDIVVRHPNVSFYDFYEAFNTPKQADKDAYLQKRSGILAQSAPNIGPMFWETIPGSQNGDNIDRSLQYTARVEASLGVVNPANTSMTISQYLGRGSTSRGALSINGALNMAVTDVPYLKTKGDIAAVKQGLTNLLTALAKNPQIVIEKPEAGVSVSDFVDNYPVTTADRRSNHWIGTTKIGTDNGLIGGSAVVDLNTRVYGTDNIYVVDASIFPGMVTTNPSAFIVAAAEKASEKILAMPALAPVAKYGQCGGRSYTGARFCATGTTCQVQNQDYAQCL